MPVSWSSPPVDDVLDVVATRLAQTVGGAVARGEVISGDTVPADDCCAGLAWVRVANMYPTDGGFGQLAELRTEPPAWAIVIEAGVLRCAPQMAANGRPPSADAIAAAADRDREDRNALILAIVCDLPERLPGLAQLLGPWTPTGPDGDCQGGFIQTTILSEG